MLRRSRVDSLRNYPTLNGATDSVDCSFRGSIGWDEEASLVRSLIYHRNSRRPPGP
jgi:hypothetical protein